MLSGHSSTLRAPFDNSENRLAGRERHVEGRDRLAETFQSQATEVFKWDRFLDRGRDAATDQYLPVLGLSTKPGGEVGYRTDGGVTRAIGKPDLAEGRVALRDTRAETKLGAVATPSSN